jgi:endonuclease/exonuclease/phosphatase family metal-dependent hydrolase
MTSNIRFDNPKDGLQNWNARKLVLQRIIETEKPDIIGTQEGRWPQLLELSGLLPEYSLFSPHRDWIFERMYPCFFVKLGKFEIIKTGDIWLSETPDIAGSLSFESVFPRLCTWMETNQHFIINTHLDHIKNTTRDEQIKILVQEINKINTSSKSIILMGDFNDGPSSNVRKILMNSWKLSDTWESSEESSHHEFNGVKTDGQRIDWILVDSKIKYQNTKMIKSAENGIYPSDHFPIVTELQVGLT